MRSKGQGPTRPPTLLIVLPGKPGAPAQALSLTTQVQEYPALAVNRRGEAAAAFGLPAGTYERWALTAPHYRIAESNESNNFAIHKRTSLEQVYLTLVLRNH